METACSISEKTGKCIVRIDADGRPWFYAKRPALWCWDVTDPSITIFADKPLWKHEENWGRQLKGFHPDAKWVSVSKRVVHTIEIEEE